MTGSRNHTRLRVCTLCAFAGPLDVCDLATPVGLNSTQDVVLDRSGKTESQEVPARVGFDHCAVIGVALEPVDKFLNADSPVFSLVGLFARTVARTCGRQSLPRTLRPPHRADYGEEPTPPGFLVA